MLSIVVLEDTKLDVVATYRFNHILYVRLHMLSDNQSGILERRNVPSQYVQYS